MGGSLREYISSNASKVVVVSKLRFRISMSLDGFVAGARPLPGRAVAASRAAPRCGRHPRRFGTRPNRRREVDEVLMGCVLPAGQGQAPARQAARGAGLPDATGATTVNKVCGSGMKAVMIGHDLLAAGSAELVVAGGMESMSNAPYLLRQARAGYRFGHGEIFDQRRWTASRTPTRRAAPWARSAKTPPKPISSPAMPRTPMRSRRSSARAVRSRPVRSRQRSFRSRFRRRTDRSRFHATKIHGTHWVIGA